LHDCTRGETFVDSAALHNFHSITTREGSGYERTASACESGEGSPKPRQAAEEPAEARSSDSEPEGNQGQSAYHHRQSAKAGSGAPEPAADLRQPGKDSRQSTQDPGKVIAFAATACSRSHERRTCRDYRVHRRAPHY